jgi:hypothetical protein
MRSSHSARRRALRWVLDLRRASARLVEDDMLGEAGPLDKGVSAALNPSKRYP